MCLYVCHPGSDGEDSATESKSKVLVVPPKQMSSALGSLLANYGSTSDSDSSDEPEGKRASANVNKSTNTKSSGPIDVPALSMVVKCPIAVAHHPTTPFFCFSHLNPKDQRPPSRKSGCPAFGASDQPGHVSLYKHRPLFRDGRHP